MRQHGLMKIVILFIVGVFVFHQLNSSVFKPITTQSANYYEAVDGLNITGMIVRNESMVTSDTGGVLHFVIGDGARVAKDGIIAQIYDSKDASITVSNIESVTKQINDIQEIQGYNDLKAADLKLLNNRVNTSLNRMIFGCADGNFSDVAEQKENLLLTFNRRQMVTGEQTDFTAQLSALNGQLSSLNASLPSAIGSLRAAQSGYFVSSTDGFEQVLSCDNIKEITPEFLKDLKPTEKPQNAVGKIVSDYEWYIAAKVSINDSLRYKEGDNLTIATAIKSSPELPVTVKQINISDSGDSAVVVFSCRQMNSELATMRTGPMKVINATYSGLKIAKKSLRVIDSKTGVYVVSGASLKFVPVKVIYSTDDYIICEQQKSNETVLRLYDDVVVKGKKLYDGKIVS